MLLSRAGAELTKSVTHLGSVVDRVHGGDVGEQRLRRADVAGRLVPPDVLLPRLQRQPETVVTLPQIFLLHYSNIFHSPLHLDVLGDPDHPARHVPHVRRLGGEEASVGATVAQRASEPS